MAQNHRKPEPKTYEQKLVQESTLQDRTYSYDKIQPSAFFWKQLTASSPVHAPKCLVPDTLILNEKESELMWVFTNESGRLCRDTDINFKDFTSKLTAYSSPNQLVAILKRPIFNERLAYSNDFKLLNSRYLLNSSLQQMGQKQHVMCLQRFIKSNGSKAFLCRTMYNVDGCSECFLITNSRNFYDKGESENKKYVVKAGDKSTIVRSRQGKNLEETVKSLKEIVQYMVFFRGIRLSEIVGDFIKDEMGNWWLVNIKAFKIRQNLKKSLKQKSILEQSQQVQKQRYQKTKLCRYCQRSYLESLLTFKMTMRMIVQVDKYLLHMGKEYNWLKRSNVTNIDSHFLYQEHKVCERCFRLYSEIQELMGVQRRLLARQGTQLIAHPKQLIFSQTNEEHLRARAKNKQIHRLNDGIPEVLELGPNTNITTTNSCPIKNDEIINKMVRFRFIVFLHEIDQVSNVSEKVNYFLEFNLFGKKSRFKLNVSSVSEGIIPLNKLKVYYFFAHSIENLQQQYMASNSSFKIYLNTQHKETQERKNIGYLELPFKELIIPINRKKDFYKFFHIQNVPYGWGLEGSIGVIPSQGEVTTAKISFQKTEGKVYIPNQNYYFCEHLTEQWIDLIKTKTEKASNRRKLGTQQSRVYQSGGDRDYKSMGPQNRLSYISSSVNEKGESLMSSKVPLGQIASSNCHEFDNGNNDQQENPGKLWQNILVKEIQQYEGHQKVGKKKRVSKARQFFMA